MIKLLSKGSLKKEMLKILCNISSSDRGKEVIMQCNVIPHIIKALDSQKDLSIAKCAMAVLANLASCFELKKEIAKYLKVSLSSLQNGIDTADMDLTQYSLCFIESICEEYPEASYVYGRMSIMKHMEAFFDSKLKDKLLADGLGALHSLASIKENM